LIRYWVLLDKDSILFASLRYDPVHTYLQTKHTYLHFIAFLSNEIVVKQTPTHAKSVISYLSLNYYQLIYVDKIILYQLILMIRNIHNFPSLVLITDSLLYNIVLGPSSLIIGLAFGIIWGSLAKVVPEKGDVSFLYVLFGLPKKKENNNQFFI
jgi:hypothetical protein